MPMKIVLFCKKPYAFGIMAPLYYQAIENNHDVLWYYPSELKNQFPQKLSESKQTNSISEVYDFKPDASFAPGNDFPHYIRGVKVQIFHGMAGEKSGHFKVRHYFDLYLTQGPYFTSNFKKSQKKYKNFEVTQTGWCKLDTLFSKVKPNLFKGDYKAKLLYAPTFSPSLTSASKYKKALFDLCENKDYLLVIKFHDKMDKSIIEDYKKTAAQYENAIYIEDADVIPVLQECDLMISDTSSVVYEFLLLDKPVITLESKSSHIKWDDINSPQKLAESIEKNLKNDPHKSSRTWFIQNYHPYLDGKSSQRMLEAVEDYITKNGVPEKRKLPFLRKRKMNKLVKSQRNK